MKLDDGGAFFADSVGESGATLLDHFAGQALAGLLSQTGFSESGYPTPNWEGTEVGLVPLAYGIAQRMVEEKRRLEDAKP